MSNTCFLYLHFNPEQQTDSYTQPQPLCVCEIRTILPPKLLSTTTHSPVSPKWASTPTPSSSSSSSSSSPMTSSPPHRRRLSGVLRCCAIWLFLSLLVLYVLYSSNLILFPPLCSSSSSSSAAANLSAVVSLGNVSSSPPLVRDLNGREVRGLVARRYNTEVGHIVFAVAAYSKMWPRRKEYLKQWWRPNETRGVVWLDESVTTHPSEASALPEIRISGNTTRFKYTNRQGQRSALRISRIVSETVRLGMEDVRWFVMGDDDTVFMVDNLVRVLSKYNHRQFYYIGSLSESHIQNIFFSYSMAYGGGGFAISYPLAKALAKMQDGCIQRYPGLYGSDERIQACLAELGVPLTKEKGFHQYDVFGSLLGLLGSHPLTPLVSIHHVDVVDPIFPRMSRVEALKHLFHTTKEDTASAMQQSICYDKKHQWSIAISWGYVVQIVRGIMSPRELETPTRTFLNWYPRADFTAYTFNTRPVKRQPCTKPFVFYVKETKYDENRSQVTGVYLRDRKDDQPVCRWKMESPDKLDSIIVVKRPDEQRWQRSPRRDCCRVMPSRTKSQMNLWVGQCRDGEISEV